MAGIFVLGAVPYALCFLPGFLIDGHFPALAVVSVLCLLYFFLFNFVIYRKSSVSEYIRSVLSHLR